MQVHLIHLYDRVQEVSLKRDIVVGVLRRNLYSAAFPLIAVLL